MVRGVMAESGLDAIVLRGVEWFAWVTGGGCSAVLLANEAGIAEIVVTTDDAVVVTDEIEARWLAEEELPPGLRVEAVPWMEGQRARDEAVARVAGAGARAADRPRGGEQPLPETLLRARAVLDPAELARYRTLGADASKAVTAALLSASPTMTGWELAGRAAGELWSRGIHPLLTLVGDEARLPEHRHATAAARPLGGRAMLVVCARRHGLYANLTRFVYFRAPTSDELARHAAVGEVERAAFAASRPGATLAEVLAAIVEAYRRTGFAGAEREHHQGGPCGYRARDALATPASNVRLAAHGAVAWNPSVRGAKIEDTVLVHDDRVEVLTVDPVWPSRDVGGLARPEPWVVR